MRCQSPCCCSEELYGQGENLCLLNFCIAFATRLRNQALQFFQAVVDAVSALFLDLLGKNHTKMGRGRLIVSRSELMYHPEHLFSSFFQPITRHGQISDFAQSWLLLCLGGHHSPTMTVLSRNPLLFRYWPKSKKLIQYEPKHLHPR